MKKNSNMMKMAIRLSAFMLGIGLLTACKKDRDATSAANTAELVQEVKANAKPFSGSEPTANNAELSFLDAPLSDAKVIGLGEASHGAKEFQNVNHRLIRYLTEKGKLASVGLELDYAAGLYINKYIRREAEGQIYIGDGPFRTEEVVNAIRWMRAYNDTQSAARKLSFYGFDIAVDTKLSVQYLGEYFTKLTLTGYDDIAIALGEFSEEKLPLEYAKRPLEVRNSYRQAIQHLREKLQQDQGPITAQTSEREFQELLHLATVLLQTEEIWSIDANAPGAEKQFSNKRDRFMADNATWMANRTVNDQVTVLWAENSHIGNYYPNPAYDITTMGHHLTQEYGAKYRKILTGFSKGTVNSITTGGPVKIKDKIPSNSINAILTRVGTPQFALLTSNLSNTNKLNTYFQAYHGFLTTGAGYSATNHDYFFLATKVSEAMDILLYFDTVNPATIIP